MSLKESIIAEIKQESATTRRLIERVPEAAFQWQPHKKSMTLVRLASHIPELIGWVKTIVSQAEWDFGSDHYVPPAPSTESELLKLFDDNVSTALGLLENQTDESLLSHWRLRNGETVLLDLPRAAALRTVVMNHVIHHRGQLSVYLRLLDVPLPPIYGPTADEAK